MGTPSRDYVEEQRRRIRELEAELEKKYGQGYEDGAAKQRQQVEELEQRVKELEERVEYRDKQATEYMIALRDARRAKQDAESARDHKTIKIHELEEDLAALKDREADRGADRKFDRDW